MPNLSVTSLGSLVFSKSRWRRSGSWGGRKGGEGGLERVEAGETAIGLKCMVEESKTVKESKFSLSSC